MQGYILQQAQLHPHFAPMDALKLCYQAAFGAEHLLLDPLGAARYLHEELSLCGESSAEPLFEPISPTMGRLNLRPWKALGLPGEWLFHLFSQSLSDAKKDEAAFRAALDVVSALCATEKLPFSSDVWQAALADYWHKGLHPVHHSETYRQMESPAYRLVCRRQERVLPVLKQIRPLDRPFVIAIDGRAGSGKSTLAQSLAGVLSAGIISMDDFFLPMDLRTAARLACPGGNVHYERFDQDVLPHLSVKADFSYQRFDCAQMCPGEMRSVRGADFYLVEGSYSCHPALGDYMDLRVFCDMDPETQRQRILARDGDAALLRYLREWIPLEEQYFKAYQIKEKAAVIL